jgi:alpha-ketoglutarate-dependent taurine dioxygenase
MGENHSTGIIEMTIHVERPSPALGAEVTGIDLREPVDAATRDAILGDVPY